MSRDVKCIRDQNGILHIVPADEFAATELVKLYEMEQVGFGDSFYDACDRDNREAEALQMQGDNQ